MTKYEKLEIITNGINAANKIRTLQSSVSNQRADDPIMLIKLDSSARCLAYLPSIRQIPQKKLLNENLNKPGCTAKYTEDSSMK